MLCADPEGDCTADRFLRRRNAAAFHGMPAAAMLEQRFAEDVRRVAEGVIDRAIGDGERGPEIVLQVGMDGRRAGLDGRTAIGRRRQRVVIDDDQLRSEEHTSELQSLMRSSYAVFCLKKKNKKA